MNLGEEKKIDSLLENYPKGMIVPVITKRLETQIVELDGDTDMGKIALFVDQLPIGDSKFVRKFLKDNTPSLDLKKQVTTPSGEKIDVDIIFGVEFFRPFF